MTNCKLAKGWDIFNGEEIQRDDALDLFASDSAALAHVKRCTPCLLKLAKDAIRYEIVHLPCALLDDKEDCDRCGQQDCDGACPCLCGRGECRECGHDFR